VGRSSKKNISIGAKYNRWTICGEKFTGDKNLTYVPVRCDCGTTKSLKATVVTSGASKSCGCLSREKASERMAKQNKEFAKWRTGKSKYLDTKVGSRYGRLTVTSSAFRVGYGKYNIDVVCDCGTAKTLSVNLLVRGCIQSCGCIAKEKSSRRATERNKTHGLSGHKLYHVWSKMIDRCHNESSGDFKYYGGRGISVCDRWRHDLSLFIRDMETSFFDGATIERIDVNGNYSPENCTWATRKEQARNQRQNRLLTIDGETKTLSEWCEDYGLAYELVRCRLIRGWPIEISLTAPKGYRLAKAQHT